MTRDVIEVVAAMGSLLVGFTIVLFVLFGPLLDSPPLPEAALHALWTVEMGGSTEVGSRHNPTNESDHRAARRSIWAASRGLGLETSTGATGLGRGAHRLRYTLRGRIWWTVDDALNVYGAKGLPEDAERYFGRSLQALEPAQLALLVSSPSRLSPWCRPERALMRIQLAMERMGYPRPDRLPELLPAPPFACECDSRSES